MRLCGSVPENADPVGNREPERADENLEADRIVFRDSRWVNRSLR